MTRNRNVHMSRTDTTTMGTSTQTMKEMGDTVSCGQIEAISLLLVRPLLHLPIDLLPSSTAFPGPGCKLVMWASMSEILGWQRGGPLLKWGYGQEAFDLPTNSNWKSNCGTLFTHIHGGACCVANSSLFLGTFWNFILLNAFAPGIQARTLL